MVLQRPRAALLPNTTPRPTGAWPFFLSTATYCHPLPPLNSRVADGGSGGLSWCLRQGLYIQEEAAAFRLNGSVHAVQA